PVVPPGIGIFSSTSTLAPLAVAVTAAVQAAAPEPTQITSTSRSQTISFRTSDAAANLGSPTAVPAATKPAFASNLRRLREIPDLSLCSFIALSRPLLLIFQ